MEQKSRRHTEIARWLPDAVKKTVLSYESILETLQEIVFRADRPTVLRCQSQTCYLSEDGRLTDEYREKGLIKSSAEELHSIFQAMCGYSVYSKQNEINRGFLTLRGGSRVGICGEGVVYDGQITNIKNISTISIRVASEYIGCASSVLNTVAPADGVLVCGAPCSGKTTLIRDIARSLSFRYKLSMLDERNELSATCQGSPQNHVGLSDVYVGYPKHEAFSQAIRSMSPEIIVCDELDGQKDIDALKSALYSGVAVIATVHCPSFESFRKRHDLMELLDTGAFESIVFLHDRRYPGTVDQIFRKDEFYV